MRSTSGGVLDEALLVAADSDDEAGDDEPNHESYHERNIVHTATTLHQRLSNSSVITHGDR